MLLYIMLAYLMLFAASCNVICLLHNAYFFAIDFCKCFFLSVSVEYYNQISTYGINGCRSTCVSASGRYCHGLLTHSLFI